MSPGVGSENRRKIQKGKESLSVRKVPFCLSPVICCREWLNG